MNEAVRIRLLSEQQAAARHGTITYDKSPLEVGTMTGEICLLPPHGYVIFADPTSLMIEQERFLIPEHRVYYVHYSAP